jgi:hypothetical protein
MENMTTLRVDLGINAQQIASQVMVNNKRIEEQIVIGIQKAIDEISDEDGFISYVKEGAKKAIKDAIHSATDSWEFRQKIQKAITERLEDKIKDYADGVAYKVLKDL